MAAMAFELRDGSETETMTLDRIVETDERNLQFPITAVLDDDAKIEDRWWHVPVRLDQGKQGACVGYAFTHELTAHPEGWSFQQAFGTPDEYSAGIKMATAVYYEAQRGDPWPGGEYPGARPQMAGTSILAGAKVIRRHGYIGSYRWANGVEDLALAVSHVGPAVIGSSWYQGMDWPDSNGYVETTGRIVGGHAYLVNGVSQTERCFWVTNSWGVRWGHGGHCRMSFDTMRALLKGNGEACIPVGRSDAG